ncbi:PREDICTED: sorting nexin-4 [Dipodomys ordii]|uniref:Sorting nexin-4 n=1 Tax=Dipodomys ordii TaxID=10020 RepID=A0A1S3FFE7_DIPOR|nr:PREDICTED: sorting nexin-4 [Dipodomys ordii]
MEQTPPDPERQMQPALLKPPGHPDSGLEAAIREEAEGAPEDSSGLGTMTENNFWLKKIEISVSEAEKRTGRNAMNMQETYTAYLIETRSVEHADGQSVLTDSLWRRYSEFELLRNYLLVYYPHIVVPPLPEKRAEFVWHKLSADNMDPDFVERRRIGLENFLLRVASHPILCRDKIFYLFLTQEGNWKETVNETGFQLKVTICVNDLPSPFMVIRLILVVHLVRQFMDEADFQLLLGHLCVLLPVSMHFMVPALGEEDMSVERILQLGHLIFQLSVMHECAFHSHMFLFHCLEDLVPILSMLIPILSFLQYPQPLLLPQVLEIEAPVFLYLDVKLFLRVLELFLQVEGLGLQLLLNLRWPCNAGAAEAAALPAAFSVPTALGPTAASPLALSPLSVAHLLQELLDLLLPPGSLHPQKHFQLLQLSVLFLQVITASGLFLELHLHVIQGFWHWQTGQRNGSELDNPKEVELMDWMISRRYGMKEKRRNYRRFTELKHYSDELQSVISHLLRVRARVADRLYGVYKVHGNYGRVFSEWSAIEKEMGDGLQSAGHHMDVYASSIDDILEDEEHYADQLKEYLFYAEALRAVCRKHELMQYDLEMAAQDLASKKQQCEELATGTVRTFSLKGMTTKLFGQETPEQREARIKVLEEQINEGEQQLKSKNLEGREFVKNAWADIERFKEQKNRDLKEALISYAIMQISMCKKGIQVWTNAKECFSKM